ncbi:DUF885 domain-containing protein [Arcanobacterium haemolyticum]|uniref:DUF885 domain-containing protein n=1 Tax=Arcanobacterium haemolyticum (strain ATCC 9345 / DSM 20595 / CCM 5947 / CCUG 17215 / LMG 16163 / NBRC 15585 / NCTC 8452 / 11018) TaxID=644284 RepID=D7BKF3_ARCHD|nr:DUF885 domain-containing protein [Arcanobacterium haemolyticum]ADH93133.1 protein of unknown function DUF885 [Arcanobacterium haemolyticum DSM 20595]SQH28110.1 Bacterial protein of uncharacterised function (DUF885) [Arcanobacterium haemolyticum]
MTRPVSPIDALANEFCQKILNESPEFVTSLGLPGADESTFSDYSPEGLAKMADIQRSTLAAIDAQEPTDAVDRVTVAAMKERLGLEIESFDNTEFGDINNITTPLQGVAEIFDLMPSDTAADWELITARLRNVPQALKGWQETLLLRAEHGPANATRQINLAIDEAAQKASDASGIASLAERGAAAHPQLADTLCAAATDARAAYAELSEFLKEKIAPHGGERDAFGRERYERRIRQFVGAKLDLDETYEWGVAELTRIIAEQNRVSEELYGPGVSIPAAMERLNNDPTRMLHGKDALQTWMQGISDQALNDLAGTHFEIPEPMKKIECMIAPSGTGAIYYTGPSDDFSRPGRMWWSVPETSTTFTTWQEKTTVYHEGVPGHHLQIGYTTLLRDQLNMWRRNFCWVSGHGEGWALYAEGLMRELGYMNDPGDYMGVLDAERLRASRVVLDIGVHLEKPAPAQYQHISPVWNRDVAWQFLQDNVAMDRSFLQFELNRYLGWAGQAPSYKIGHRMWKQLRADAELRDGANFNLKDWHTQALSLGSVGLDVLREAMA